MAKTVQNTWQRARAREDQKVKRRYGHVKKPKFARFKALFYFDHGGKFTPYSLDVVNADTADEHHDENEGLMYLLRLLNDCDGKNPNYDKATTVKIWATRHKNHTTDGQKYDTLIFQYTIKRGIWENPTVHFKVHGKHNVLDLDRLKEVYEND